MKVYVLCEDGNVQTTFNCEGNIHQKLLDWLNDRWKPTYEWESENRKAVEQCAYVLPDLSFHTMWLVPFEWDKTRVVPFDYKLYLTDVL